MDLKGEISQITPIFRFIKWKMHNAHAYAVRKIANERNATGTAVPAARIIVITGTFVVMDI